MTAAANQPKVAYLTGQFPRATDTFIQREISALRSIGFVVETFAIRRPCDDQMVGPEQSAFRDSTTYVYEALRSAKFFASPTTWFARSPARFLSTLRLALSSRRPGLKGLIFQLIYFIEATILAEQVRKRQVRHIHNHFADSSCTVAMLAANLAAVPFSFTLHGSAIFFEPYTWSLGKKVDQSAFCACISFFTRSQALIFAATGSDSKTKIVHCGIDPSNYSQRRHDSATANLLFVGRLIEAKGISVILKSLQALQATHPNLHLTIVGDGPHLETLRSEAQNFGLADRITFAGSLSQSEVANQIAEADIFLLPSYAEGVPVVLMEALAGGVPVIASNVGGISELVEDAKNGFLIRPGDAAQLTDRIDKLLADPGLRTQYGKSGRNKVFSEFDALTEATKLGELFKGCSDPA